MSEEKLNIDTSQREGDILDYDPVAEFGAVSSYDTDIWIEQGKTGTSILKPKEIRASDEEENNPVAGIIDGSPLTKWSVRGRSAWVLMDFGRPILLEKVKIDFHMKKNEKRLYEFGIFAVTGEAQEGEFEYTSIADNLSNGKAKSSEYEVRNYSVVERKDRYTHIQTTSSSKLLFWFTNTSSKRKRFSIMDIQVTGVNISDVAVKEPTEDVIVGEPTETVPANVVAANDVIEQNDDIDTFGSNGIINLPEYVVTKELLNPTKNFQGTSLRFDFESEQPTKSIIVGGLFYIDASVLDDLGFKSEGGPHNDNDPECGRCNDIGLSYDGKQVRYRKETSHPDYTSDLDKKDPKCGDLRKKWVAVQYVSQLLKLKLNPDDEPIDARRFRLHIDENAKKADGTLNNNYELKYELLDVGQFKDGGKTLPVYNEMSKGCDGAQTTIRLDKLKPAQLKTEGLFIRYIEDDDGEPEPTEPPTGTKLPPKLVVIPQNNVTMKGQVVTVDASGSTDPDGEINCYVFKQVGQWLKEERLGLKALTGNDLGKCQVTYPSLASKPKSILTLAVTVIDNDKLSKTLPVQFIDKVDYGGLPPPPPPPPEPTGEYIYEAGKDGKWNTKPRKVTGADPECPKPFVNGKGLEMHASGNPQLEIAGDGTAILVCQPGHGRFYTDICNYNSILTWGITFLDKNVENSTCQLRSRHQEGGAGENRFGGLSAKISPVDCGLKIELYHNVHQSSKELKLKKPLEIGKEYIIRYTAKDTDDRSGIFQKLEVDYNDGAGFIEVVSQTVKDVKPYFMDRASFEKRSYFWLRMNNVKAGKIKFNNPRLQALP